jgi:hypothetical protein
LAGGKAGGLDRKLNVARTVSLARSASKTKNQTCFLFSAIADGKRLGFESNPRIASVKSGGT